VGSRFQIPAVQSANLLPFELEDFQVQRSSVPLLEAYARKLLKGLGLCSDLQQGYGDFLFCSMQPDNSSMIWKSKR